MSDIILYIEDVLYGRKSRDKVYEYNNFLDILEDKNSNLDLICSIINYDKRYIRCLNEYFINKNKVVMLIGSILHLQYLEDLTTILDLSKINGYIIFSTPFIITNLQTKINTIHFIESNIFVKLDDKTYRNQYLKENHCILELIEFFKIVDDDFLISFIESIPITFSYFFTTFPKAIRNHVIRLPSDNDFKKHVYYIMLHVLRYEYICSKLKVDSIDYEIVYKNYSEISDNLINFCKKCRDVKLAKNIVKVNGLLLKHLRFFINDESVVKEAINNFPLAFQYASRNIKRNFDFIKDYVTDEMSFTLHYGIYYNSERHYYNSHEFFRVCRLNPLQIKNIILLLIEKIPYFIWLENIYKDIKSKHDITPLCNFYDCLEIVKKSEKILTYSTYNYCGNNSKIIEYYKKNKHYKLDCNLERKPQYL